MSNKKKQIIIYMASFFIPLLLTCVFFTLSDTAPFGSKAIMTGDLNRQFVDFFSYFKSVITSNNDFLYTFEKNLGGDMPGLSAYYLNDPLIFLLFLFPGKYIAIGLSILFALQNALCGLAFCVYLNKSPRFEAVRRGPAVPETVMFSTAYAMNGFVFGYQVLMIYFSNLIVLPFVLLMFDRLLHKWEFRCFTAYSLLFALYIYMNYYMGYMLSIYIILYYISYLIKDAGYLKSLPHVIAGSVTGVLIASFSLVPAVVSLKGEKSTAAADWGIYRKFRITELLGSLFSGMERNDRMPLIYCSVFAAVCAVCFFADIRKSSGLKEKLSYAFLIISISLSMYINPIDDIWHGFNTPVGFPWRYSYFLSMVIIFAGFEWFSAYLVENNSRAVWYSFVITALYLICLLIMRDHYLDTERLIINIILVPANAAVIYFAGKKGCIRAVAFSALFVILAADTSYNAYTAFAYLDNVVEDSEDINRFYEKYDDIKAAIDYVKNEDDSFYRTEKDFYRTPNDPMMFDYMGITHSSSCEKESVRHFLSGFGFRDTGLYAFYNLGSTSFADCFLGIKYYVSRFDEIHKPYEYMDGSHESIGRYYVYRNPYALDMAFYAPYEIEDIDFEEGNTFEKQNKIANTYGADDIYIRADYEVSVENDGERRYHIETGRDGPLYYFFDSPKIQGAELYVNGEYREPYFTETNWSVLCAGVYGTGEPVDIVIRPLQDDIEISEACFYYENTDAIREFKALAGPENSGEEGHDKTALKKVTSSHLNGRVFCRDEGFTIFTIPYDRAWKIKVDGKKTEASEVLGNLMAVQMDKGYHEIDMQYIPSGIAGGMAATLLGLLILVLGAVYEKKFFCE